MTEKKNQEVQKTDAPKTGEPESRTSRRGLFASIGAGAAAAALVNPGKIFAASTPPIPSIRIPKEVTDTLAEATHIGDFSEKGGITGAEVFAKACKDEDLAALFCCPGNYQIINAISADGIPAVCERCGGCMT